MCTPADSSLAQVAQQQVLKFVAEVRSVADCLSEADLSTPSGIEENLKSCYLSVVALKPRMLAMLDILEFCRTQEHAGHDGELNALFACLNFEYAADLTADGGSASWEDKARDARIGHGSHVSSLLLDEFAKVLDKPLWDEGSPPPPEIQSFW